MDIMLSGVENQLQQVTYYMILFIQNYRNVNQFSGCQGLV